MFHEQVSNHLKLLSESLQPDPGRETSVSIKFSGNRNLCPVPGTLYNKNTLETFKTLDRRALFNLEVQKVSIDNLLLILCFPSKVEVLCLYW